MNIRGILTGVLSAIIILIIFYFVYASTPTVSSVYLNSTTNGTCGALYSNLSANWTINEAGFTNITNWYLNNVSIMLLNLPMENISNTTRTYDYSGFGKIGNVSNVNYSSTGGYDGFGAYEFNYSGTPHNISFGDDDSLIGINYTWSLWFKEYEITNEVHDIFAKWKSSATISGIYVLTDYPASKDLTILSSSGAAYTMQHANYVTAVNTWVHLVITSNDTSFTLFKNGVRVNSTGNSNYNLAPNNIPFCLGYNCAGITTLQRYFNGTIDDFMVYNRTLSDEQINFIFENKSYMLSSQETKLNEVWQLNITPVNASEKGSSVESNYLQIVNYCPIYPNFINITTFPSNETKYGKGISLNATVVINDSNSNDLLNVSFTWYEEGIVNISNTTGKHSMPNATNVQATGNGLSILIPFNLTSYTLGYNYSIGVYVCDGTYCNQTNSSVIYINNSLPFFRNITLYDNITTVSMSRGIQFNASTFIEDIDNDKLNISFNWLRIIPYSVIKTSTNNEGQNITNGNNGTEYYSSINLTSADYSLGFNYTIMIQVCDNLACNTSNWSTSYLYINNTAPFFYNITFWDNVTDIKFGLGKNFNGSFSIGDLDSNEVFNISTFWYEGDSSPDTIIISNNTAGSNMSNYTSAQINGSMKYIGQNLTNTNYRVGYNYSLGIYVCDSSNVCNQSNSTVLFINNSLPIIKNITLYDNVTNTNYGLGGSFNCSTYIEDGDESEKLNITFEWYEGVGTQTTTKLLSSANNSNFNLTQASNGTLYYSPLNLTSAYYRLGYNYTCRVRVYDAALQQQIWRNSTSLFINNSVSSLTAPTSTKTSYCSTEDVNVTTIYTDPDGDAGNITYIWYKGTSVVYATNLTNKINNTNISNLLYRGNYSAGNIIIAELYSFDGAFNSTISNTSSIQINDCTEETPSVGGGGGGSSSKKEGETKIEGIILESLQGFSTDIVKINKETTAGEPTTQDIEITNPTQNNLIIKVIPLGVLNDIIKPSENYFILKSKETKKINLQIIAEEPGIYQGMIKIISDEYQRIIDVTITVNKGKAQEIKKTGETANLNAGQKFNEGIKSVFIKIGGVLLNIINWLKSLF